ncbi:hypothetical protein [Cohnella luojiensis]|uniref:Uncharacterized protein n=1 Tax=Cohnella luojiensis TaxID=652876 RepID=A0A4Y8M5E2_9BACL|nr:hypothetical protein [Cohnella luojiensis]TFE29992.1 hypothetical protein E2980_04355 [Cohnella luojiensis]
MPNVPLKQWSLMLLVGIMIVLFLSQLPAIERGLQQRRQAVNVFQPNKATLLTDDNLVDSLSMLPLQEQLIKVGWDHAILTVDLQAAVPDDVWGDIGELIVFSYGEVHNVKQVLIRVFSDKDKNQNRSLLIAVESRKLEWTDKELSVLTPSSFSEASELMDRIRLLITPKGKRWIANFAN